MTFEDLRYLIFTTRQLDGVSWFFADLTDHAQSPLCEIHGYGPAGERTVLIPNIRPDITGSIRPADLEKIVEARALCGPSKAFMDKRPNKNTPDQRTKYDIARKQWLDGGSEQFLSDPDGYCKGLALRAEGKGKGPLGAVTKEEAHAGHHDTVA